MKSLLQHNYQSIIIESIECKHTVHQMYAESNVTSCIWHGLGICTLITDQCVI